MVSQVPEGKMDLFVEMLQGLMDKKKAEKEIEDHKKGEENQEKT